MKHNQARVEQRRSANSPVHADNKSNTQINNQPIMLVPYQVAKAAKVTKTGNAGKSVKLSFANNDDDSEEIALPSKPIARSYASTLTSVKSEPPSKTAVSSTKSASEASLPSIMQLMSQPKLKSETKIFVTSAESIIKSNSVSPPEPAKSKPAVSVEPRKTDMYKPPQKRDSQGEANTKKRSSLGQAINQPRHVVPFRQRSFVVDDDTLNEFGDLDSVHIQGQCTTMCSTRELIDRLESHQISVFEVERGVNPFNAKSAPFAVKKYRRAAAATQLDPSEVRTENALVTSVRHLIDEVIDRDDEPWHEVHRFISDRFRACRADFVCQGLHSVDTIECYEFMVRFHILAFDELADEAAENFEPIQNREKLTQTLTSLRLFYRDIELHNDEHQTKQSTSDCQDEMLGYLLLTSFNNNRFLPTYLSLSPTSRESEPVDFAYRVYQAHKDDNYASFFALLEQSSYLQACLMIESVHPMRARALQMMSRSFHNFPVAAMTTLFCMDDQQSCAALLDYHGIIIDRENGTVKFLDSLKQRAVIDRNDAPWTTDRCAALMETKRPARKRDAVFYSNPVPASLEQRNRKRKHRPRMSVGHTASLKPIRGPSDVPSILMGSLSANRSAASPDRTSVKKKSKQ